VYFGGRNLKKAFSAQLEKTRDRAIGYVRVSTARQVSHETSLDEQERQIGASCDTKNRELVKVFVEQGATGRNDKRPAFLEMIKFACDTTNNIKYVCVYNFSRYFRHVDQYLQYKKLLNNAGVKLVSATQDIPEGPIGNLLETILAAFDAHASQTNADTVRDIMRANALDGFWNGSKPPFGYQTVVDIVLRRKEKKKLAINGTEAVIVRLIFSLYLRGQDGAAPMGIKAIANHLNKRGYRQRGKLFYTSVVEKILKRETYTGVHHYNQMDSRTKKPRPPSEWVSVPVPIIIDQETFDGAQRTLKARRPQNTPPRVVTGPTLLTGIAVCGRCSAGMLLRTGKSGRYKYLTCAGAALKGKKSCVGQAVRMDVIDEQVLKAVEDRVFEPSRLTVLLAGMLDRSAAGKESLDAEIARERNSLTDATSRLRRIYDSIEVGLTDVHDPLLKDRIDGLKLQRHENERSIETLTKRRAVTSIQMDSAKIAAFATAVRHRLRNGDPGFKRAWLHQFVKRVTVGPQEIRISGPKDPIFSMLTRRDPFSEPEVPSYAREWRALGDSNPCYRRERAVS
jgi:site-specific DNA recombinase